MGKLLGVVYVEPNFHNYRAHGFPNDPHYENGDQWGLNNYGQNGGTNDADIDASEAWQITTGSNVLIGVIDDGVDAAHEDLTAKVGGDAGVYGGNQNWAFGHGTHVSGIAAAIGNNGRGIAGVNWSATINSQRIENGSDQDFYNGIMAAVNAGSKILNNSWGGYDYSTTIRMAFANAYKLNAVSIASMGNDNTSSVSYPAGYGQGIIAVGATDRNDVRSIWGVNGSNYGNHIDVTAPGTAIWSSIPYTNQYDSWNGTSMAAPFVSGIASLMLSVNPNLCNDDIEQIIRLSADDKGPTGWDPEYGTGRVNARKALDYLRAPYTLTQSTTTPGGTDLGASNAYWMVIYGASGLSDGWWIVKRHEVQRSITFAPTTWRVVWGRGVATNGWADNGGSSNFSMGWCDAIAGTVTITSATLRTYVYEVYNNIGQFIGWYPTSPDNATFGYTVLGRLDPLAVSISGPSSLGWKQIGTWTANVSGGAGPVTYQWYKSFNGGSTWQTLGTSSTQTVTMLDQSFLLRCDVHGTLTGQNASNTYYVEYGFAKPYSGLEPRPTSYALHEGYPNPFNPSTQINFDLPEAANVSLIVYDVLGRKVVELANEYREAGYHSATWDASGVASGVYFARFTASNALGQVRFAKMSKLVLIK